MSDRPDPPKLRPATRDELAQSLSFALRYNGRRRDHQADELMADITADRLVEYLERSGYVVMCKPPPGRHSAPLGAETAKAPIVRGWMTVIRLLNALRGTPDAAAVLIATAGGLSGLRHVRATFIPTDDELREVPKYGAEYAVVLAAADE